MKYLFIVVSVVLAAPVFALAQATVSKVSLNPPVVGFSVANATVKVGDVLDVKTSKGETCVLTVSRVSQTLIFADTNCLVLSDLPLGTEATVHVETADEEWAREVAKKKAPAVVQPVASAAVPDSITQPLEENEVIHHFGFGVYYSLADSFEMEGKIGGLAVSGTTKTDTGAGISLYYNNVKPHKLGSYVLLDHEFGRKGGDATVNISGTTYAGTDPSTYTMTVLVSNIAYGISDTGALYGGINVPIIVTATESPDEKYYGQIGVQLGVMYKVGAQVDLGFEYRTINIRSNYNDGTTSGTTTISFDGGVIRFGYRF